jgi:hypothetical protein
MRSRSGRLNNLLEQLPIPPIAREMWRDVRAATCMVSVISTDAREHEGVNDDLELRLVQMERILESKEEHNRDLLAALKGSILGIGVGHCNHCGGKLEKGSPSIVEKCGAVSEL